MIIVDSFDAITLVGGANPRPADITTALRHAPILVAADGGADAVLAMSLRPRAVIGDMDSLGAAARHAFADCLHPVAEQSTTDFEKCLIRVAAPLIVAVGFSGGRLDHTLAVLNVLARYRDRMVILLGPDDLSFLVPQGHVGLDLPLGMRLSLLPLADVRGDTRGLRWPVSDAAMHPTGFISPSNEVAAPHVEIRATGPLLVSLPPVALPSVIAAVRRNDAVGVARSGSDL